MSTPLIAAATLGSQELVLVLIPILAFCVLVLALIPAILSFVLLKRIPAEHRKQEPGLAFLLIIPLFSLVWSFFVYPRIADSLQSYFTSKGQSRGDCGRGVALALCICTACSIIPFVNMLTGLAALVLMIIFFVKSFDLTGQIQQTINTTPTPTIPSAT